MAVPDGVRERRRDGPLRVNPGPLRLPSAFTAKPELRKRRSRVSRFGDKFGREHGRSANRTQRRR